MLPEWFRTRLDGLREIARFDNRFELIVNRLFYRGSSLAVYRVGDLEVLVDHRAGDQSGIRHVLASDMYRRFLAHIARDVPLSVLDLGAATGGFPLLLRLLGFKLAKVCCVEMHPKTFARLECNTRINLSDIEFINMNAAVSGDGRSMDLRLGPGGTGDNIFRSHAGADGESYVIQGTTFDALAANAFGAAAIDLVKMDIEGAEFEVLLGDRCTTLHRCRYLLVEIHPHPEHTHDALVDHLRHRGFRLAAGEAAATDTVSLFVNEEPAG